MNSNLSPAWLGQGPTMKPFESGPVCRSGALFTRAVQLSRRQEKTYPNSIYVGFTLSTNTTNISLAKFQPHRYAVFLCEAQGGFFLHHCNRKHCI